MKKNELEGSLIDHATVVREKSCIGCRGCGLSIDQMDSVHGLKEIYSITANGQIRIIWNSLGKPLIFLVLATLIADLFYLNEPQTVIAAIAGFIVGCFNCIVLTETLLEKVSVN